MSSAFSSLSFPDFHHTPRHNLLNSVSSTMKLLACLALVAAAALATFVDAEVCDKSALVVKLLPLASDKDLSTCLKDTGYTLSLSSPKLPTKDQSTKMCASTACKAVLTKIEALDLPSCNVTVGDTTFDPAQVVTLATTHCK
ncbi:hypothetical protein BBJ28_00012648 [Nothophytophthora sp. Chile5]|nr:hypothetical protein BBJ28_00012648 [Nothophytophthora sp. Chile5]